MASIDKLIARLRANPRGASFDDLDRVLKSAGYEEVRVASSHHIFRRADGSGPPLTIKRPSSGQVAPGAVRDVLAVVERQKEEE